MPGVAGLIAEAVKLLSKLPPGTVAEVVGILREVLRAKSPKSAAVKARAAARMVAVKSARDAAIRKARKVKR